MRMCSVQAGTLQHLLLHRHHLPTLWRSSVWARRCPISQPWNPRMPAEQWANEHLLLLSTRSSLCGHTAESNTSAHNLPSALPKMTSLLVLFLSTGWVFIQTSESTYYKMENMKQRAEAGEDSKIIQTVQVLELGWVEQTLKLQLTINNPVWWWCKSCDFP